MITIPCCGKWNTPKCKVKEIRFEPEEHHVWIVLHDGAEILMYVTNSQLKNIKKEIEKAFSGKLKLKRRESYAGRADLHER